ncbi:MAG: LamG domain-containing protein [bacterium]
MIRVFVKLVLIFICSMLTTQIPINSAYSRIDPKSIMGMWLLDEGSGEVARDYSGNKNDGKIIGAKWVNGKFGKGLEFDGSSHVEIPASKTTDDCLNGFTYLIWVMPTANPPNQNTRLIERDWHNPTIQIGPSDFYGSIAVNSDQSKTNVRGGKWVMKEWSFVALTYDGSVISLYVDGEMVKDLKVGKPDVATVAPAPHQNAIWLASWKAPGWDFRGVLDEACVFNVPLDSDDIKSIMNNGLQKATAVFSIDKKTITWAELKTK